MEARLSEVPGADSFFDPYGHAADALWRHPTVPRPDPGQLHGDKSLGRCMTCQKMWDDHDGWLVNGLPTGPETARPLCYVQQFEEY